MKTAYKSVILSLIICVNVSFCHPVKPLNERSTELAWQAWLLVDQSNNNNNRQNGDAAISSRKITAKSIFVVPDFNKTSLPSCAEGYQSDSMGRCIKISKIDAERQLDFILENYLKNQFADYEEVIEAETETQGPLQINIPLFGDNERVETNSESDIAIVLTPKKSFDNDDQSMSSVKLDIKRHDNEKFNVDNIAAIFGVKPEEVKMTTIADMPTTHHEETTTEMMSTTTEIAEVQTETTEEASTTDIPSTTDVTTLPDEETLIDGDALYFRLRN